jgi:membrane peptidoglycan carboxypeptidase
MKKYYFFTGSLFLACSFATAALIHLAETTIEAIGDDVFSYRHLSDANVYDALGRFRAGDEISRLKKFLTDNGYAECASVAGKLDDLPAKSFCRKGNSILVKTIAPFESFVFQTGKKGIQIQKILDRAENPVLVAEIPARPFGSAALDENGQIAARVRFEAFRGKDLANNLKADFLQICLNEEDREFFEHRGTNWRGLARAARQNFKIVTGRKKAPWQGGSSITEQAAKLLYTNDRRGVLRRLWSAFLADAMEQRFTKTQILELWVNSTVMGIESPNRSAKKNEKAMMRERIYGFQTAAQSLFSKNWPELEPAEQAFLAILPRSPRIAPALRRDGKLNPNNPNHRELEEKLKTALMSYAEKLENQGETAKAKRYRSAVNQPVVFKFKEDDLLAEEALAIFLERDFKNLRREFSLKTAGMPLTIVTTVDRDFQKRLSLSTFGEMLKNKELIKARLPVKTEIDLQVDIAVVSSADGELKAFSSLKTLGGQVLPNRSNVNAPSQIASAAKPLHLAAALSANKITIDALIRPDGCFSPDGFQYESDRRSDSVALPLWRYLVYSNNNAFICVANALGIGAIEGKWREVFDLPTPSKEEYKQMGGHPFQLLRGLNRSEAELPPLKVAEGYTALANHGLKSNLRVIKTVYAGLGKIELPQNETKQVFTAEAAETVSRILQINAQSLKTLKSENTVAIKTGSSPYSYWLVMYSPKIVIVGRFLVAGSLKSALLENIYAKDIIQPFMDRSVLKLTQEMRPEWLTGSFGAPDF